MDERVLGHPLLVRAGQAEGVGVGCLDAPVTSFSFAFAIVEVVGLKGWQSTVAAECQTT